MNAKQTDRRPIQPPAWEYKNLKCDLSADLAKYGVENWELVAVVAIPHDVARAMFYFKRQKG